LDENYASGDMPYLTELYGKEVTNILERDHNRLIIWSGALEEMDPIVVDEPTFTPDILPTLLNLFGVDFDSRLLPGRDALSDAQPLIYTLGYDWKTDLGTYIAKTGTFVPKDASVEIPEGYVKAIKTIVKNKITYSKGVLNTDYFRHIYGE
jgi:lipoteichoic acid synthase